MKRTPIYSLVLVYGFLGMGVLSAFATTRELPVSAAPSYLCPELFQTSEATPDDRILGAYLRALEALRNLNSDREFGDLLRQMLRKSDYYSGSGPEAIGGPLGDFLEKVRLSTRGTDFDERVRQRLETILEGMKQTARVVEESATKTKEARAPMTFLRGHAKRITKVEANAEFSLALSSSVDGTLILWDLKTSKARFHLKGHGDSVSQFRVSSDWKLAMSVSRDGGSILWDLEHGKLLHAFPGNGNPVPYLQVNAEFSEAITATQKGVVTKWNLKTGAPLFQLKGYGDTNSLEVSPDFSQALVGWMRKPMLIDLRSGEEIAALPTEERDIYDLKVSPDFSRARGEVGEQSGTVVWDLKTKKVLWELQGSATNGQWMTGNADFSTGVFFSEDGHLTIREMREGGLIRRLGDNSLHVWYAEANPEFTRLLIGTNNGPLAIWDLNSGEQLVSMTGHQSGIFSAHFTNDLKHAISGSYDYTVGVWDLEAIRKGSY